MSYPGKTLHLIPPPPGSQSFFAAIICILISLVFVVTGIYAADTTQPQDEATAKNIEACKRLIDHGKQREAFAELSRLHDQTDPKNPDPNINALMARTALLEGRPDKAAEFVEPWAEHAKMLHHEFTRAYLAVGETLLAQGHPDKALSHYNWLASGLDSSSEPEELALATEGYGIASFRLKDSDEAIRSLEFALGVAKGLPDPKGDDLWLITRIQNELNQLLPHSNFKPTPQSQDADKFGPDFVIFREAETQRRQKQDYIKADTAYCSLVKKFLDSPYVEPSIFYDALCYLKVGKVDAAEKQLIAFCKQYPNSLYTGEAELELGRLEMEVRLDPKTAQDYFVHVDAWIDAARKPDAPQQELKVKDAAKDITTPPQQRYKSPDSFGNVLKENIQPGQLVNAKTSPWYLDDLAAQCAKMEGFVFFSQGKTDEALAAYKKVLALDPQINQEQSQEKWNDFARLKWGIDHGYLVAHPEELKLYNDRQRFIIMVGDFYQVTEQWDQAIAIFQRLLRGEFGGLNGPQQDYPEFALGNCYYRNNWQAGDFSTRTLAAAQLEIVVDGRHGTLTWYRAAMAFVNTGHESTNPKVQAKAERVLRDLADCGVKNDFVYNARISLADEMIANGHAQEGFNRLAQFTPDDGKYYKFAQLLIHKFTQDATQPAPPAATQPTDEE